MTDNGALLRSADASSEMHRLVHSSPESDSRSTMLIQRHRGTSFRAMPDAAYQAARSTLDRGFDSRHSRLYPCRGTGADCQNRACAVSGAPTWPIPASASKRFSPPISHA